MKKRIALLSALVILVLPLTNAAASNSWSASVNVPDHCTVVDSDGVSHNYSGQYLGICALQAAIDAGGVSGVQLSNAYPSLGLFLTSIGGVSADPSSEYWALFMNGGYASAGLSQLPVIAGDMLVLELHNFSDTFLGDRLTLTIGSLISTPATLATPGGGGLSLHDPFDVPRALSFMWSKQDEHGSFGSSLIDDWVAIATAGGGAGDMRAHIAAYMFAHPPALSSVTDHERHAMALEALGVNPYLGPIDYITPIVDAFDGIQVGDPSQDNDDIFALFPLMHTGYTLDDEIILKTAAFIVSRQREDGSWDGNPDMTAAAVQALALVPSLPHISEATGKALAYLHAEQADDGGFGNVSATSWVLQAATALGQGPLDWSKGTYQIPEYYIATQQEIDGGIGPMSDDIDRRIWATAYAVPAIEHKTWDALLSHFPKPASAGLVQGASTSTVATSTALSVTSATPVYAQPKPKARAAVLPKTGDSTHIASTSAKTQTAAPTMTPLLWMRGFLAMFFPWFF